MTVSDSIELKKCPCGGELELKHGDCVCNKCKWRIKIID
jgi:hypothetical protein